MEPTRKRKTNEDVHREALLLISPGTRIREAISAILQSRTGALLCFGDPQRLDRWSAAKNRRQSAQGSQDSAETQRVGMNERTAPKLPRSHRS